MKHNVDRSMWTGWTSGLWMCRCCSSRWRWSISWFSRSITVYYCFSWTILKRQDIFFFCFFFYLLSSSSSSFYLYLLPLLPFIFFFFFFFVLFFVFFFCFLFFLFSPSSSSSSSPSSTFYLHLLHLLLSPRFLLLCHLFICRILLLHLSLLPPLPFIFFIISIFFFFLFSVFVDRLQNTFIFVIYYLSLLPLVLLQHVAAALVKSIKVIDLHITVSIYRLH